MKKGTTLSEMSWTRLFYSRHFRLGAITGSFLTTGWALFYLNIRVKKIKEDIELKLASKTTQAPSSELPSGTCISLLNYHSYQRRKPYIGNPIFRHVRPMKTDQPAHAQADQSSLSAWRKFASLAIQNVTSEDSDQTVRKCRLIRIFARHAYLKVHVRFLMLRFMWARIWAMPTRWHEAHSFAWIRWICPAIQDLK